MKEKNKNELNKGDIIELTLEKMAQGGDCIGRIDGFVVFVKGGIPGERVKAKITKRKKSYASAVVEEIVEAVPARVEAECGVYEDCGGCQLQHMSYEEQLKNKKMMIEEQLQRIGGFETGPEGVEVKEVVGADSPYFYRNKAQFPLGEDEEGWIVSGFFRSGTHELIPHERCSIQHPLLNKVAAKTLEVLNSHELSVYDEKEHRGLLRHLVIRAGICTNQAMLVLVTSRLKFPEAEEIAENIMKEVPELVGVLQNVNSQKTNVVLGDTMKVLKGQDYYLDYIGKVKFAVSPRSFFQTNTLQAEKLYSTTVEYAGLTGKEIVYDAYCGTGSIGLYLADKVEKVIGIESVAEAVVDARKNAEINNIENACFIEGEVEEVLPKLARGVESPDVLIFDPPRKGLAKSVVDTVLSLSSKTALEKIVYVSCNPATLARDLKLFNERYRVEKVQPVDMFPQTYHIETVSKLIKRI